MKIAPFGIAAMNGTTETVFHELEEGFPVEHGGASDPKSGESRAEIA